MPLSRMQHSSRSSHPAASVAAPIAGLPDPATDVPVMRWFGHLLETRPMAFWSGIWVSTFLIGVVAFGSLLSPSASERRSVSAIALGSDSGVATQPIENQRKVPLWMFGAIAVTCTAGSILVSRQLKPGATPPAPRRRVKKQRPAAARVPAVKPRQVAQRRRKPPSGQHPQRLKPYSPSEPLMAAPLFQPLPQATAIAPPPVARQPLVTPSFVVARAGQRSRSAIPASQPVRVPVVPDEQSHLLDGAEPRLVDDLAVRQQQPMQSWLVP